MRIIYLTTSMVPADFYELNKKQQFGANPSNQNFHHKIIKSLALSHQVDVICYRPVTRYFDPKKLSYQRRSYLGITYHYLPIFNQPLLKQIRFKYFALGLVGKLAGKKTKKNPEIPVIMVDALSQTLTRLALQLRKKYHYEITGIITDHPRNLTGAKKLVAKRQIQIASSFDRFVCLTPSLNQLINIKQAPFLVIEGVVEERQAFPVRAKPYLFFCGAMHERYGLPSLLEAFTSITVEVDLLIAGHGPKEVVNDFEGKDNRIHFLGHLSQDEIYKYEAGALCNINPRPTDVKIDDYSVPSKMFEYLSSGTLTLSTDNEIFSRFLPKEIIWAGSGTVIELKQAIESFLRMDIPTREKMGHQAKEETLRRYGLQSVNKKLTHLLKTVK